MKIAKVRDVKTPTRGTSKSAGLDFYIPKDFNNGQVYELSPHKRVLIPSGIKASIPEGFMLEVKNKSGICTSTGLVVGANIVDEDYQGEMHLHVINTSEETVNIIPDTKIVQMILVPVSYESVEEVPESELFTAVTDRGEGGFGHTGVK